MATMLALLSSLLWGTADFFGGNLTKKYKALAVTGVTQSFGALEDREEDSEMEVRASWTPTSGEDLVNHVNAWLELLAMTAGLEPIPQGVSSISRNS